MLNILGIETSGKIGGVAVSTGENVFTVNSTSANNVSRDLLLDCSEVCAQARIELKDLERICVGLGPGSYTGLRIGITAAVSLAWSLDIPVGGVSTFQALAAASIANEENGTVCIIGDARMQEVFLGLYHCRQGTVSEEFLKIVPFDELKSSVPEGSIVVGAGIDKITRVLEEILPGTAIDNTMACPPPEAIISQTVANDDFKPALQARLEPLYMKASEPERMRHKKQGV